MATKKKSTTSKKSSTSTTNKKLVKSAKKLAKKNPKAFIAIVIVAVLLVGIGIGGYFAYKYFNPTVDFRLNGKEKVSIAIDSTYKEKGYVAKYNGTDISDKVVVSYYLNDEKQDSITTDIEKTYTVQYDLSYQKYTGQLKRKVVVTQVEPIEINFLELGNKFTGDCTFIKAGDTDILIDAGSREGSAKTICEFVDDYCDDGILEYVIATHAHQDHISGFVGTNSAPGIFKYYKIDTLIDFAKSNNQTASKPSGVYTNYINLRDEKIASGDIAHHYTANDCIQGTNGASKTFEVGAGIEMEILDQKYYRETTSDENDYSVCALFTQADNHYLFTGDLEKNGEESLVAFNNLPEVELYKGGHHGSYTANTDALLNVIKPKTVCICCCAGSDEYVKASGGLPNSEHTFPAQEAVDRIAKYTTQVYVTTVYKDDSNGYASMNGNICFQSEKGTTYTVIGSNNSIILKDTDWFKANRTWPSY